MVDGVSPYVSDGLSVDKPLADKRLVAKPRFRSDIEGLRAIAILLVVAYHAGIPGFSGGYIGVDIFLVISGYLIAWLMISEVETTGTIDLMRFYARRAKRLLPASAVMIVITAAISAVLYAPFEQLDLAKTAFATATYRSNIYVAQAAVDYLGADIKTNPLLHTWSLSVEEQFYFVWPLFVMLACGVLFKKKAVKTKQVLSYRRILLWLIFTTAISFSASLYLTDVRQSSAFFLAHARAWEFLIGALALIVPLRKTFAPYREVLGGLGIAGILIATVCFNETTRFPGLAVLLPSLSTVLVLRSCSTEGTQIAKALNTCVFQRIGQISYSWYLWHWPVLVFASTLSNQVPLAMRVGLVILSLLPAVASYRFIENPVRRSRLLGRKPAFSVAIAFLFAISGTLLSSQWTAAAIEWSQQPEQALYTAVRDDNASVYGTDCHTGLFSESPNIEDCTTAGASDGLSVVLLGDSHAAQWYDAIAQIAREKEWHFTAMTKAACSYVDILTYRPEIGTYKTCMTWREKATDYIQQAKPDLVIVSASTQKKVYPFSRNDWLEGTERTIAALSQASKQIIILRDTPDPGFDVPTCLARNQWRKDHAALQSTCELSGDPVPEQVAYAAQKTIANRYDNVSVVNMTLYICREDDCDLQRGDMVVYRDDNHLTVKFTLTLKQILARQIEALL